MCIRDRVKALQTAALAKVDVRLMIPERSDSTVLRFASFSYITEMLRAGVKVYFYQPGILHSKTIIIDDELCSVGSTNFDFRSFEHNFEANAFIYDREDVYKRQPISKAMPIAISE